MKLPSPTPVLSEDLSDALIPEKVCSVDPFDDVFYFTTEFDFKVDQHQLREALQSISSRLQDRQVSHAPSIPMVEMTESDVSRIPKTIEVHLFRDGDPPKSHLNHQLVDCTFDQQLYKKVYQPTFAPIKEAIESLVSKILSLCIVDNTVTTSDDENAVSATPKLLNEVVHSDLNRKLVGCPVTSNQDLDGEKRPFWNTSSDGTASRTTDSSLDPFDDIFYFTTEFDFKVDQQQIHDALQSIHTQHNQYLNVEWTGNGVLTADFYEEGSDERIRNFVCDDAMTKSKMQLDLNHNFGSLPNDTRDLGNVQPTSSLPSFLNVDDDTASDSTDSSSDPFDDIFHFTTEFNFEVDQQQVCEALRSINNRAQEGQHVQGSESPTVKGEVFSGATPHTCFDDNEQKVLLNPNSDHKIISAVGHSQCTSDMMSNLIVRPNSTLFSDLTNLCALKESKRMGSRQSLPIQRTVTSESLSAIGDYQSTRSIYITTDRDRDIKQSSVPPAINPFESRVPEHNINSTKASLTAIHTNHQTKLGLVHSTRDKDYPRTSILHGRASVQTPFTSENNQVELGSSLIAVKDNLSIEQAVVCEPVSKEAQQYRQALRLITASILRDDPTFDSSDSDSFADVSHFTTDLDYEMNQENVDSVVRSIDRRVHTAIARSDPEQAKSFSQRGSLPTIVDHMESSSLISKRDDIARHAFTEKEPEGLRKCIRQCFVDETLLFQSSKTLSPTQAMFQEIVRSKSDEVQSHPDPMDFISDSAFIDKNNTYAEVDTFGHAIRRGHAIRKGDTMRIGLAAMNCLGQFDDGPNTMLCLIDSEEDSLSANSWLAG